nr:3-methyl-2-oxobutanoate dehydrogenase subunit beta [Melioribacteraceae bacterium]
MILSDGALGQMMEKVELFDPIPRTTEVPDWATVGKPASRDRNFITSLHIQPDKMEEVNIHLQKKYKEIEKNETRVEVINCEDADFIITAYGLVARIC